MAEGATSRQQAAGSKSGEGRGTGSEGHKQHTKRRTRQKPTRVPQAFEVPAQRYAVRRHANLLQSLLLELGQTRDEVDDALAQQWLTALWRTQEERERERERERGREGKKKVGEKVGKGVGSE